MINFCRDGVSGVEIWFSVCSILQKGQRVRLFAVFDENFQFFSSENRIETPLLCCTTKQTRNTKPLIVVYYESLNREQKQYMNFGAMKG